MRQRNSRCCTWPMTRAKEKLVILTSLDDPVKSLGKLGAQLTDNQAISPYVVRTPGPFPTGFFPAP